MKTCFAGFVVVLALACTVHPLNAQSTAFTYQGALSDENGPATGLFDMIFGLFATATDGTAVSTVTNTSVSVSNGLFVAALDFGEQVFDGTDYWLEVGVRPEGEAGFIPLSPRQALTAVPYANHARKAVNLLNPTFLGTTTDAPLELFVNNTRALRLETTDAVDTVNVVAGSPLNQANGGVKGATIAGGGTRETDVFGMVQPNVVLADFGTVGGGVGNTNAGAVSVIGGGMRNFINQAGSSGTIGGGEYNFIMSQASVVAGGRGNSATNQTTTVGGGESNLAGGNRTTVGGGFNNRATGDDSCIGGGSFNRTTGRYAAVAGGSDNLASGRGAFIGGGGGELEDGSNVPNYSRGRWSVLTGGAANEVSGDFATIGGGNQNVIGTNAHHATISGGFRNTVGEDIQHATIGGGDQNAIVAGANAAGTFSGARNTNSGIASFIGGGIDHLIGEDAHLAVICGGDHHRIAALGNSSAIVGGARNEIGDANAAFIGGGRDHLIGDQAQHSSIVSGHGNIIGGSTGAIIGAGLFNSIGHTSHYACILSGDKNYIGSDAGSSVIVGGARNTNVNCKAAVISGGIDNIIDGAAHISTICGGNLNSILAAPQSIIAGGGNNVVENGADHSFIGGGSANVISTNSRFGIIPGGYNNLVAGEFGFAAGRRAKALHNGCFVWADSTGLDFNSISTNEFAARATGGVRFTTSGDGTSGVQIAAGGMAWSAFCDRNLKENFESVDGKEVLQQVAAMPISRWNMKSQDPSIRHIGPTAQDFHAAFGLGESDRRINTVDADGVALAAIQGLNQKLEEKESRIEALEATVAELKALISALGRHNETP